MSKIKKFFKRILNYKFPYLWKHVIDPRRWYAAYKGHKATRLLEGLMEPHIIEQYMLRINKCSHCIKAGNCVGTENCQGCGCPTWSKMVLGTETCHCGRWGKIVGKEEWEEIKTNINLKIEITHDPI